MKLLVDQDVYHVTVEWLKNMGHDVITAKEADMSQASDEDLLKKAVETGRLMVTRDKDYGTLVFLKGITKGGVILLRISPRTIEDVHSEIRRIFLEHTEEELKGLFCVVEPHRHRIRRI